MAKKDFYYNVALAGRDNFLGGVIAHMSASIRAQRALFLTFQID